MKKALTKISRFVSEAKAAGQTVYVRGEASTHIFLEAIERHGMLSVRCAPSAAETSRAFGKYLDPDDIARCRISRSGLQGRDCDGAAIQIFAGR